MKRERKVGKYKNNRSRGIERHTAQKKSGKSRSLADQIVESSYFEAEIARGTRRFATKELRSLTKKQAHLIPSDDESSLPFTFEGDPRVLLSARTIDTINIVRFFDVRRPSSLLQVGQFSQLIKYLKSAMAAVPQVNFQSFRIAAAGNDSEVFKVLSQRIEEGLGIPLKPESGDLKIRFRPTSQKREAGWEVLVRLSKRPLVTRPWRVRNAPGAINATLASGLSHLVEIHPDSCVLNLMSGTGTFLIEWILSSPLKVIFGGDNSRSMTLAAKDNIQAAKISNRVCLLELDAMSTPFARQFDIIVADPPWGERLGRRDANYTLTQRLLTEISRILKVGGKVIIVSQRQEVIFECLEAPGSPLALIEVFSVAQRGFNPFIFLLQKT